VKHIEQLLSLKRRFGNVKLLTSKPYSGMFGKLANYNDGFEGVEGI
jgi:hypothetical protein